MRIRGLDGLRTLAAGLVLLYHFFPNRWAAGFIGVDVFFVLSGFLITALLIREYRGSGRIDIRAFLERRYRRLVPAVAVATAGSFALGWLVSRDAIVQAWWQLIGALTGTYNWFEIANHSSYFDRESPYLLANMWSLAVEQQFYLVWPFIVAALMGVRRAGAGLRLAGMRRAGTTKSASANASSASPSRADGRGEGSGSRGKRAGGQGKGPAGQIEGARSQGEGSGVQARRIQVAVPIALAALSVVLAAVLVAWAENGDVTRAYVGTDTHFFGLALGAALAFALPGIMEPRRKADAGERESGSEMPGQAGARGAGGRHSAGVSGGARLEADAGAQAGNGAAAWSGTLPPPPELGAYARAGRDDAAGMQGFGAAGMQAGAAQPYGAQSFSMQAGGTQAYAASALGTRPGGASQAGGAQPGTPHAALYYASGDDAPGARVRTPAARANGTFSLLDEDASAQTFLGLSRAVWRQVFGIAGAVAVVALALFAFLAPAGLWLYPWGMLAASLLALAAIRALLPDMEGSPVSAGLWAVFDSKPLRWLGERSYGIYLWHWPLIVVFRYGTNLSAWQTAILVTALSVHFAHLSYTYVETPIRREGFLAWLRARIARAGRVRAGLAAAALAALVVGVLVVSPAKTAMQAQIEAGQAAAERSREEADAGAGADAGADASAADQAAPEQPAQEQPAPEPKNEFSGEYPSLEEGANVTFIGDSLGAGATPSLLNALPKAYADAVPSRQIGQAIAIVRQLESEGKLRPYVALWIGTNVGIVDGQLEELFDLIGPNRFLVLTTLHAPDIPQYDYVRRASERIRAFAAAHPDRVRLAKWDEVHPAISDPAGIHPGPSGYAVASQEIVRALKSFSGEQ